MGWLSHLARSELELGRVDEARPLLERTLALRVEHGENPLVIARDQLRLARALVGVDPARARGLAEEARSAYARKAEADGGPAATSKSVREGLAEADAWLAENPAPVTNGK